LNSARAIVGWQATSSVVGCNSKKGAEEIRSFELSGQQIFFDYDEMKSKEAKKKQNGSNKKALRM